MRAQPGLWFPLAALLAIAWLSSCRDGSNPVEPGPNSVSGRLLLEDGSPAAGAKVSLVPDGFVPSPTRPGNAGVLEGLCDGKGGYRFAGVPAGRYNLLAAKDGQKVLRGSLAVQEAEESLIGLDTLRRTGSLVGTVALEPGDDPRTVIILLLGTPMVRTPDEVSGSFRLGDLAEGRYRMRMLSTIRDYLPLDTVVDIRSGREDTLPQPLGPPFAGAPEVRRLEAAWDSVLAVVRLDWSPASGEAAAGYNVYRARAGAPLGTVPFNAKPLLDTAFVDSIYLDTALKAGERYVYAVKSIDRNGNVSRRFSPQDTATLATGYGPFRTIAQPFLRKFGFDPGGGEIFGISQEGDAVAALAIRGGTTRSFPLDSGTTRDMRKLRVIGDNLYILGLDLIFDRERLEENTTIKFRRFSLQGELLDSSVLGILRDFPALRLDDFWVSSGREKLLFFNQGDLLIVSRGEAADTLPPVGLHPHHDKSRIVPFGDQVLAFQCDCTWQDGEQTAFLTYFEPDDFSVARQDTLHLSRGVAGFTTNGKGEMILLYATYLEILNAELQIVRRVPLHRSFDLFGSRLMVDDRGNIVIEQGRNFLVWNRE